MLLWVLGRICWQYSSHLTQAQWWDWQWLNHYLWRFQNTCAGLTSAPICLHKWQTQMVTCTPFCTVDQCNAWLGHLLLHIRSNHISERQFITYIWPWLCEVIGSPTKSERSTATYKFCSLKKMYKSGQVSNGYESINGVHFTSWICISVCGTIWIHHLCCSTSSLPVTNLYQVLPMKARLSREVIDANQEKRWLEWQWNCYHIEVDRIKYRAACRIANKAIMNSCR